MPFQQDCQILVTLALQTPTVFQALSASNVFSQYISGLVYSINHLASTAQLQFTSHLSALMNLLNQVRPGPPQTANTKLLVNAFPPSLASRAQEHDAHELLMFVRDQIDKSNITIIRARPGVLESGETPFQGRFKRLLQCSRCNYEKQPQFETFEELIVPLTSAIQPSPTLSG